MPNDTRCSDEQIAMWMEIYAGTDGNIDVVNKIAARANAFDKIYQCYRTKLYTYLRFMGCKEALANQIFENIWEKIIKNRSELAEQAKNETLNLGVHIFTIARTALLQRINELKSPELTQLRTLPANILNFASTIAQLPLQKRDTFLLRRMGLSLEQIAQVQQSPP